MDIHKDTIVVCVLPADGESGEPLRKTYSTFRNPLVRMRVWMKLLKGTEIVTESTGIYWRPVWNVLEEQGFRLVLVNPAQVKLCRAARRIGEMPGGSPNFCKINVWRPALYRRGKSLRQLLRHRVSLLEERNEVHNQIRNLFETANLKLGSVASHLLGVTGILQAMVAGEDSPELLSWKVRGKLREKEKLVKESLKGCFGNSTA